MYYSLFHRIINGGSEDMTEDKAILIVEDEVLTAMSLQHDLKRMGYDTCSYVTSGEKALLMIAESIPSVVIMDISLAGKLTGLETAEKIAQEYRIPIILTSGYDYGELSEKIEPLENVYFLKKPLHKSELASMLKTIV